MFDRQMLVYIRLGGIMGFSGFSRRVFCQNQDLWDYRIFRIPPARMFDSQALIHIPLGGILDYGDKRKVGEPKSCKSHKSDKS